MSFRKKAHFLMVPILGTEVAVMSDLSKQNPAVHGGSIKFGLKADFFRHFLRMGISEVAVGPHCKTASVLVA